MVTIIQIWTNGIIGWAAPSRRRYLVPIPNLAPIPDLVCGLAADPQHFLALELQLSRQRIDGLVQGVDLVVQVGDAVATGTGL